MSAFKDGRFPIEINGKLYHMLFDLNVLDELNEKAGGYENLTEFLRGKEQFSRLKWLLTLLLNEGADEDDEEVTESKVGRMIHTGNLFEVQSAIYKAFSIGISGTPEPPEIADDEPVKNG